MMGEGDCLLSSTSTRETQYSAVGILTHYTHHYTYSTDEIIIKYLFLEIDFFIIADDVIIIGRSYYIVLKAME